MSTLLEARRVTKSFGSFVAVRDVDLDVRPGEVVGLLGANGAGKTTLIRILLGLLAPTRGTTTMLGGDPSRQARRQIGYVPQGLGLYPDLTVRENLAFVASTYGVTKAELPPELLPDAGVLVGELGLGSQRQLAFACAMLHDPALFVLDEPTSGVDPLTAARLWDAVRRRSESGVGALVTTHNMQEAQQCDRLLLMSDGALVASGSEAEVIGDTRAVHVDADEWAAAFAALQKAGFPVSLAGTSVRVLSATEAQVRAALTDAGVAANVRTVDATLEERMLAIARPA